MKILTVGATSTGQITLPYCPQFLLLRSVADGVDLNASLKVNVAGHGLTTDLNATGVVVIGQAGFITPLNITALGVGSLIELADGVCKGKTTDVTVNNEGSAAVEVYALSICEGSILVRSTMLNVLANTEQKFNKFYRVCTAPDTDDEIAVTCVDGTNNRVTPLEMVALNALTTNYSLSNGQRSGYLEIDNKEQVYSEISYIPKDSTRTFFVQTLDLN